MAKLGRSFRHSFLTGSSRVFATAFAAALFVGSVALAQAPTAPATGGTDAASGSADAQGMGMKKGPGEMGNGPCRADMAKLCAGVQPGEGRLMKCLKEKESQVSAECKASWEQKRAERKEQRKEQRQEHRQEMRAACQSDFQKLCAGMQPGDGRIIKCLKEKEAQVSEGCKSAMSAMGPKRR